MDLMNMSLKKPLMIGGAILTAVIVIKTVATFVSSLTPRQETESVHSTVDDRSTYRDGSSEFTEDDIAADEYGAGASYIETAYTSCDLTGYLSEPDKFLYQSGESDAAGSGIHYPYGFFILGYMTEKDDLYGVLTSEFHSLTYDLAISLADYDPSDQESMAIFTISNADTGEVLACHTFTRGDREVVSGSVSLEGVQAIRIHRETNVTSSCDGFTILTNGFELKL